jgi:transcriptional regulator with XRE-family HTH domain
MSIQQNLKRIRSYLNMTQLEMAKVACMSKSNYGKIERCEIGLNETKAIEICKKLNINHLDIEKLERQPFSFKEKKKVSKKKSIRKKLMKKIASLETMIKTHLKTNELQNNVCKTCGKTNKSELTIF